MLFGIRRRQNYIDLTKDTSPKTVEELREQMKEKAKKRKTILGVEEKIEAIKKKEKEERLRKFEKSGFELGKRIAEFRPPREDFSFQENVLRQMFGRGEHIWGTRMKPVELNFDLNARQRGDTETAKLFGFG